MSSELSRIESGYCIFNQLTRLRNLRDKPLIQEPLTLQVGAIELREAAASTNRPALQGLTCPAYIGTAGWNIPSQYAAEFCGAGTHLQRYAARLNAVEINSSFYRSHRRQTYERWATSVPRDFRFAVKIPKEITHECALLGSAEQLDRFACEVAGLGAALGVLLVQLPPRLAFDAARANRFFEHLRSRFERHVGVACEPRHPSWFTAEAESSLLIHEVARVAADPPRCAANSHPGGWRGLDYYRLHGAPQIYYSNYDERALDGIRHDLAASCARGATVWCIFDNTAASAALGNALAVRAAHPVLCT
jgi:uncharacterized protein YecE (DUF72 family)